MSLLRPDVIKQHKTKPNWRYGDSTLWSFKLFNVPIPFQLNMLSNSL